MPAVDPRLVAALRAQLERREAALASGAEAVGWKLGMGDRESIGGDIAVGHLTAATVVPSGTAFPTHTDAALHADAELAVELAEDVGEVGVRIARYAVAVELVDLAPLEREPESVVVSNVFHRAVAFGAWSADSPEASAAGRLSVRSDVRASARVPTDVLERLLGAARILASVGERLRAGDRVITGSIVQVPVHDGDDVVAAIDGLGVAAVSVVVR